MNSRMNRTLTVLRYTILFAAVFNGSLLGQPAQTGKATTSGICSPATTGSNNTFIIKCGISPDQGKKIIELLNQALASKDLSLINAKLDELLQVAGRPVQTQTCIGSACVQGSGQAVLNQYGAPKLIMTDQQRDYIRDAMRPYAGMTVGNLLEPLPFLPS